MHSLSSALACSLPTKFNFRSSPSVWLLASLAVAAGCSGSADTIVPPNDEGTTGTGSAGGDATGGVSSNDPLNTGGTDFDGSGGGSPDGGSVATGGSSADTGGASAATGGSTAVTGGGTGEADPTCATGILNSEETVCCDLTCGACGGAGCDIQPGGTANCCMSGVLASGVSCSGNQPPCVMDDEIEPPDTEATALEVVQAMDGGFNLGNVFDNGILSTDVASNKQVIDLYGAAGMKHIRFPVTWIDQVDGNSLADADGSINFSHARFQQLKELIDYALSQGLFVVVNTHHEFWLKDNYTGALAQDVAFGNLWKNIATYFKDYPSQLIFEVLNEPEGAFGDWSPPGPLPTDVNSQQLTRKINLVGYDAIRGTGGSNTTRVIMVAPNAQGNQSMIDEIYPNKASLPGGGNDQYLAIQVHTYDPWGFCGQTGNNGAWPGAAALESNIQNVANHATTLGVPVNYGEFGVGRDGNQAERNTDLVRSYYSTIARKTLSSNMSYTVWDDRGWFGLVNGTGTTFIYNIVPTMLAP